MQPFSCKNSFHLFQNMNDCNFVQNLKKDENIIKDATIINEGLKYKGSVLINGEHIEKIFPHVIPGEFDFQT